MEVNKDQQYPQIKAFEEKKKLSIFKKTKKTFKMFTSLHLEIKAAS